MHIPAVHSMLGYIGNSVIHDLLRIIPINARITTRAKIILYLLYNINTATSVAAMSWIIVRIGALKPSQDQVKPLCTIQAVIFAMIATDIHQRYKLKGT